MSDGKSARLAIESAYAEESKDNPPGLDEVFAAVSEQQFSRLMLKQWLMLPDRRLGMTPLEALRQGRKVEVVAVAKTLGEQGG